MISRRKEFLSLSKKSLLCFDQSAPSLEPASIFLHRTLAALFFVFFLLGYIRINPCVPFRKVIVTCSFWSYGPWAGPKYCTWVPRSMRRWSMGWVGSSFDESVRPELDRFYTRLEHQIRTPA